MSAAERAPSDKVDLEQQIREQNLPTLKGRWVATKPEEWDTPSIATDPRTYSEWFTQRVDNELRMYCRWAFASYHGNSLVLSVDEAGRYVVGFQNNLNTFFIGYISFRPDGTMVCQSHDSSPDSKGQAFYKRESDSQFDDLIKAVLEEDWDAIMASGAAIENIHYAGVVSPETNEYLQWNNPPPACYSALSVATAEGKAMSVKALLKAKADPTASSDGNGVTPLRLAGILGREDIIALFNAVSLEEHIERQKLLSLTGCWVPVRGLDWHDPLLGWDDVVCEFCEDRSSGTLRITMSYNTADDSLTGEVIGVEEGRYLVSCHDGTGNVPKFGFIEHVSEGYYFHLDGHPKGRGEFMQREKTDPQFDALIKAVCDDNEGAILKASNDLMNFVGRVSPEAIKDINLTADPDVRLPSAYSALYVGVLFGSRRTVDALLTAKAHPTGSASSGGFTPLMLAELYKPSMVEILKATMFEQAPDHIPEVKVLTTLGKFAVPVTAETSIGEIRQKVQEWKPEYSLEQIELVCKDKDTEGPLLDEASRPCGDAESVESLWSDWKFPRRVMQVALWIKEQNEETGEWESSFWKKPGEPKCADWSCQGGTSNELGGSQAPKPTTASIKSSHTLAGALPPIATKVSTSATCSPSIWIMTWGSRGDVQPYVALGMGLQKAGYRVTVLADKKHRDFVIPFGLGFIEACGWEGELEAKRRHMLDEWLATEAEKAGLKDGSEYYQLLELEYHEFTLLKFFELLDAAHTVPGAMAMAESIFDPMDPDKWLLDFCKDIDDFAEVRKQRRDELIALQAAWNRVDPNEHAQCYHRRITEALKNIPQMAMKWGIAAHDFIPFITAFRNAYVAWQMSSSGPRGTAEEDDISQLRSHLQGFIAWQTGKGLSEYFESLEQKRHAWEAAMRSQIGHVPNVLEGRIDGLQRLLSMEIPSMVLSATRAYENCQAQDRPALVLHSLWCFSPALALRKKYCVETLFATVNVPDPNPAGNYGLFSALSNVERQVGLVAAVKPVGDLGAEKLIELAAGPEQVLGISSLLCEATHLQPRCTGPWVLEASEQLEAGGPNSFGGVAAKEKLESFLAAGEAPVYIGWGSMSYANGPGELAALAVKALKLSGKRGVIVAGWSGMTWQSLRVPPKTTDLLGRAKAYAEESELLSYAEKSVLMLHAAPHEWIFPQCACTVHHGGVGTLNAALRAGKPTIVSPVVHDQFQNGPWVQAHGLGLCTRPLNEVSAEELASAIHNVLQDEDMSKKAKEVAEAMREESGVPTAVAMIEEYIQRHTGAKLA